MTLPEALHAAVLKSLRACGDHGPIVETIPTQEGHNCRSVRLSTSSGRYFLKWKEAAPQGQFPAERRGLELLAAVGPVRVPQWLHASPPEDDAPGHILTEWIDMLPSNRYSSLGPEFGELLARFHQAAASNSDGRFGLGEPSFLASREQDNSWDTEWPRFFVQRRLRPEVERVLRSKRLSAEHRGALGKVCERAEEILSSSRTWPVLLHGDFWRGNIRFDLTRRLVLYDPAAYWGDREVDLATLCAFDPLPAGFQQAYDSVWPLPPGKEARRDIYMLHYLLVSLNAGARVQSRLDALLRRLCAR